MRRTVLVVCVAAVPLMTAGCTEKLLDPRATVEVAVNITCENNGVQASISPYIVEVYPGDVIQWTLTGTATEFDIDKKKFMAFPYGGSLPYKGDKEKPVKTGNMKSGVDYDKPYGYTVTAACTSSTGQVRRIIIDPDMIIIRRAQSS